MELLPRVSPIQHGLYLCIHTVFSYLHITAKFALAILFVFYVSQVMMVWGAQRFGSPINYLQGAKILSCR